MNKLRITGLLMVFPFIFSSCGGDDETVDAEVDPVPVVTDISVTSSESSITYINQNDLNQKLEIAVSYNYGIALESDTEKQLIINTDSTQANATIAFKTALKDNYIDSNTTNNSVAIALGKEVPQLSAVELKADGPGDTYALITSVLAPGANPIETPDCSHPEFGEHIDEVFDSELNANVFRFYIHTRPDDDRCINFDRQRNEIKTYSQSPDNLLGVEGEKVVYNWKFKLDEDFQISPNFTHLHQLKSVGGELESIPMYTLTARKSSPDRLELRYAETDDQVTLATTDLAPLLGTWMEVTETITYGTSGTYEIEIKKVSDQVVLFEYSDDSIINWRADADFVRPKWGIYRSLLTAEDLSDETLFFADFSIEEIEN